MPFLKMFITALGQVLNWCGAHQARQFIEIRLRQGGYDDNFIDIARDEVTLLVAELMTALMTWILRFLDSL